jgi:hypothetical protein
MDVNVKEMSDETLMQYKEVVHEELLAIEEILSGYTKLDSLRGKVDSYQDQIAEFKERVNIWREALRVAHKEAVDRRLVDPTIYFIQTSPNSVRITTNSEEKPANYYDNTRFPYLVHTFVSTIFVLYYIEPYIQGDWFVDMDERVQEIWNSRPEGFDTRNLNKEIDDEKSTESTDYDA